MGIHNAVYVLFVFIYTQASFAHILTSSRQDDVAVAARMGLAGGGGEIIVPRRDCSDTRTCYSLCRESQL